MSGTALRDALHEVASVAAGPVDDAWLARVADRAKGGEQAPTAPRGGGRRRWVVGGLAVAAVAALVVVGVAQALRPVEVTPASGPGSLPDQIFPTRQHILTMEQAPIGRVSMVYAGPLIGGVTSWVAVGADTDEYRALAPASAHLEFNDGVDVAPDGSAVVVGRGGARSGDLRLEFIDASSGQTQVVPLPDDGAGGRVESLRWDYTGDEVVVQATVTNGDDPDRSSGQTRLFKVTVSDGSVDLVRSPASWSDLPVGWGRDGSPLMGNDEGQSPARRFVVSTTDTRLPRELGRVSLTNDGEAGVSLWSVSPDARLLAALPQKSDVPAGLTERRSLVVWRLSDGKELARVPLGRVAVDSAEVVAWSDPSTPVISYLTRSHRDPVSVSAAGYVGHVTSVSIDGTKTELVVASGGSDASVYRTSRLASEVVAGGEVREAQPPEQPWYDPRTAWPTVGDSAPRAVLSGLVLIVLIVGGLVLVTRRISRRRLREARSRSGS